MSITPEPLVPTPPLGTISFRLFRGDEDYRAIAALSAASASHDNADPDSLLARPLAADEIAGLALWLGQAHRRLLLAEDGGGVVGFQLLGEWMNARGSWQYLHRGLVHPEWRGRGIGTTMLHWAEQELRSLAAGHPTNGAASFATDAGTSPDAAALLTVVFDSGADSDSLVWRHVLPRVATFAQVVAYDRAGLGQSEPGPLPRTTRAAADDLHTLLTRAGAPGPYVLVGHSGGGLNLRLFASLHPKEVIGLVLVDSPHEDMIDVWRSLLPAEQWERLVGPMSYEGSDYVASRAQLKAAAVLPDMPLVVLTARHGSYPYGWPREALDAVRVPMQGELARLTSCGRQIIVDDTGHEIHRDRPELVVEAIREVLDQERGAGNQQMLGWDSKYCGLARSLPHPLSPSPAHGRGGTHDSAEAPDQGLNQRRRG